MPLTAPELEILKQLWQSQPLSARQIHQQLEQVLGWSYSSTRKTLERMQGKGLISAEPKGNKILYSPIADKIPTLATFAKDFAQRIFELKSPLPVAMFTDSELIDEKDIKELEKLLNDMDETKADGK